MQANVGIIQTSRAQDCARSDREVKSSSARCASKATANSARLALDLRSMLTVSGGDAGSARAQGSRGAVLEPTRICKVNVVLGAKTTRSVRQEPFARSRPGSGGKSLMASTNHDPRVGGRLSETWKDYRTQSKRGWSFSDVITASRRRPPRLAPVELQGGKSVGRGARSTANRLVRMTAHEHVRAGADHPVRPSRHSHHQGSLRHRRASAPGRPRHPAFQPKPPGPDGTHQCSGTSTGCRFRSASSAFSARTLHVIRDHEDNKPQFAGPRLFVRLASLEMHPLDTNDRLELIKEKAGLGLCNITKCCTEVCPEHIRITDNAIIPLKERVVTEYYDPVAWLLRKVRGKSRATAE